METNHERQQKSVVDRLTFGPKTSKRVTWEAWSFRVTAPGEIEVTNDSYGVEKANHRYRVTCGERDGEIVPETCECPADAFNEESDCKHKVAVAAVGGRVLLDAAGAFQADTDADSDDPCWCTGRDLPCWDCFGSGQKQRVG